MIYSCDLRTVEIKNKKLIDQTMHEWGMIRAFGYDIASVNWLPESW